MSNKKAIVIGASGQDGCFMCDLLESKGYLVQRAGRGQTSNLRHNIDWFQPDEIYNFAGISDVITPFDQIQQLFEVNAYLPVFIMDAIRDSKPDTKFFQASSSLIFGRDKGIIQNEQTPFNPLYPYGAAKLFAHNMVREYREKYGMFAVNGIFFSHESERRKDHFFSRKIIKAAARRQKVTVGRLDIHRDYGYAGDFVEAAWMMLQADHPKDYVIGTGKATSLQSFVEKAFRHAGIHNWEDYVSVDESITRKKDTEFLAADYSAIYNDLGWQPKTNVDQMIKIMIDAEKRIA